MKREAVYIITILGVCLVAIYFIVFKGILAGGVFIAGIIIGLFNSFVRGYSNKEFLINKKMGVLQFLILYILRIAIPVMFCFLIMRIEGVLTVVFLLGFAAQFFNISLKENPLKYS